MTLTELLTFITKAPIRRQRTLLKLILLHDLKTIIELINKWEVNFFLLLKKEMYMLMDYKSECIMNCYNKNIVLKMDMNKDFVKENKVFLEGHFYVTN